MTPNELNRGQNRRAALGRLVQLLQYISDHRAGFYRRDMGAELEMSESSSERWLTTLDEAGLVWRWRQYGNDPYLWRPTFAFKCLPSRFNQARRAER